MVRFCSRFGNARITFPVEPFGLVETDEILTDQQGNAVTNRETGEPLKKRAARPRVIIEGPDNPLNTDNEDLIACLREHSGNVKNGGDAFFEEAQADIESMAVAQGFATARVPEGGVTDKDVELVRKLYGFSKRITPNAQDSAMQEFAKVIERFGIRGVTIPPREKGIRQLKARMIIALGALEDAGIFTDDPGSPKDDDAPAIAATA